MSTETNDLVIMFKPIASLKHDEQCMRTRDKWIKMAKMYVSYGMQEMASPMMQRIQDNKDKILAEQQEQDSDLLRHGAWSSGTPPAPIGDQHLEANSTAFMHGD